MNPSRLTAILQKSSCCSRLFLHWIPWLLSSSISNERFILHLFNHPWVRIIHLRFNCKSSECRLKRNKVVTQDSSFILFCYEGWTEKFSLWRRYSACSFSGFVLLKCSPWYGKGLIIEFFRYSLVGDMLWSLLIYLKCFQWLIPSDTIIPNESSGYIYVSKFGPWQKGVWKNWF